MDNSRYIESIEMAVAKNGLAVRMDLATVDGEQRQFLSNVETLHQMVATMIGASQQAANNLSTKDAEALYVDARNQPTVMPINVAEINVGKGRVGDELIIDFHLGLIRLSFSVHQSQAEHLVNLVQKTLLQTEGRKNGRAPDRYT